MVEIRTVIQSHQSLMQTCDTFLVRTTISIPGLLLEDLKRSAAERGVTVSVVIEDAVRHHLSRTAAVKAPKFRLRAVRGKLVNPHINLKRTSGLIAEEDALQYGK